MKNDGIDLDWTKVSNDPKNKEIQNKIDRYISSITIALPGGFDTLVNRFRNSDVLDIGVAAHNKERYISKDWKHRKIVQVANSVVGIDILENMVKFLNQEGYNVHNIDATSSKTLNKKFDYIFAGDIIEHLAEPIKLFDFANRHLNDGGVFIMATPNPFYIKYIIKVLKNKKYIASLEHVSWITETMALELARRSKMQLSEILRPVSLKAYKRYLQNINLGLLSSDFFYIFKK